MIPADLEQLTARARATVDGLRAVYVEPGEEVAPLGEIELYEVGTAFVEIGGLWFGIDPEGWSDLENVREWAPAMEAEIRGGDRWEIAGDNFRAREIEEAAR